MSNVLRARGMGRWLVIPTLLALSACESNINSTSSVAAAAPLAWPFPWWTPPPAASGKSAPAPWFPPWLPGASTATPPKTCTPACTNGQVCTDGVCACPHAGDVMCAKGCTNPQTDNFACGCTAGGIGAVCLVGAECCGGKCVTCPSGQKIDPSTCTCGGSQPALWLLTNASKNMFFGLESELKKRTRCSFTGGGVGCKATDLVEYKKLIEPAATVEKTREAACAAFSKKHYYPIGIGWKATYKANGETYGLWDSSTDFLMKCVPDGPP